MMRSLLLATLLFVGVLAFSQETNQLQPYVLIVQPIVLQSDEGTGSASMALPEDLVDRAYQKAGVDFHFLEPIYYNNTKARDGQINLNQIVKESQRIGLIKGQNDIVNMFFVNSVDGLKGPLGRGMMGGNITFIALGENSDKSKEELRNMQAFVIAHEVGHNLSLEHTVDDENVCDTIPNIQGDGAFKDRIDPQYSLNDYQIEIIHKSPLVHPRTEFLTKEKAKKAILDETYEPYFSVLQKREISTYVKEKLPSDDISECRIFAKDKFASAVIDFTEKEKACISFVVDRVNEILQSNQLTLMSNHPWRLIKVEDWLCGGFAHTRGTYIILSQRHINHLSKDWSDRMTKEEEENLIKKFGALLVHEQMHALQRTYKTRFVNLYTESWNFVKANVQDDLSIQVDQVSNPDAPIAEWLIPMPNNTNSYYWVRTLLKHGEGIPIMGRDFTDKVFVVEKKNGVFKVKKNIKGDLVYKTLEDIAFYKHSFPVTRGLDHPNEISAYMLADLFKSMVVEEKPFEAIPREAKSNTEQFLKWVQIDMKL